ERWRPMGRSLNLRVAGNGAGTAAQGAFSGGGGPAVAASLNNPTAVALDGAGNLYISDQFNQRFRKVSQDGRIRTVAGNGYSRVLRRRWTRTERLAELPRRVDLD